MNRMKKVSLLTRLIEKLRENESWCGETHVQKAVFFAQELTEIPMGFDFILYKHGPFSFDLRNEITALRADGLLKLEAKWPSVRLAPTEQVKYVQDLYPKTLGMYEKDIEFVTKWLGNKGVFDLECLATAFYVKRGLDNKVSIDEIAKRLMSLKPHISQDDAMNAIQTIDEVVEQASNHVP